MRSALSRVEAAALCPLKSGQTTRRTNREGGFQGCEVRLAGDHFKRLEEKFLNGFPICLDVSRSTYMSFGKVEFADTIDAGPPAVFSR